MGLAPRAILRCRCCATVIASLTREEGTIRSFGVGLLALATVAAAGILLRYRRPVVGAKTGRFSTEVEALYAAGL